MCIRDSLIYSPNDFEKPIQRITGQKIAKVSLAPGAAPFHLVCYIPGSVLYSCTVFDKYLMFHTCSEFYISILSISLR